MTYDQWKCTDPNEPYNDEWDCEHEDYDIDVRYHDDMEREERRQRRREFWRKVTLLIRWPIFRILERIWPRKSLSVLTDDEIPF